MAAVNALIGVVRAHDGIDVGVLHCFLERIEINLVERAVGHVHVHGKTVGLLVVEHIVLQAATHSVGLCGFDVRHHNLTGEVRILTHVFERTSVHRRALDVHARTKHDVLTPERKLLTHGIAIDSGEVAVPCGGEAGERRERHDVVVGPFGRTPCVPFQLFPHSVRTIVHVELTNAETRHSGTCEFALGVNHLDFLMGGHPADGVFHTVLKRSLRIEINLCLGGHGGCCKEQRSQNFFVHNEVS